MNFKISIITVVLNAKDDLIKTIDSVQKQSYKNFEHIIKDGISNDGTSSIEFNKYINTFMYQMKDIGIYDAMNQGFKFAKGDLIMFLNAGDSLFSNKVLFLINENFKKKLNASCLIGYTLQTEFIDKKNSLLLGYGWPYRFLPLIQYPHPSFILKKEIAKLINPLFDKNLNISSDYKQQLIIRKKGLFNPIFGDFIITEMPIGGASTINSYSYLKGFIEVCRFSFQIYKIRYIYILLLKIFLYFYKKYCKRNSKSFSKKFI